MMDDKLERMVKVVEYYRCEWVREISHNNKNLSCVPILTDAGWHEEAPADWLRACDVVEERRRAALPGRNYVADVLDAIRRDTIQSMGIPPAMLAPPPAPAVPCVARILGGYECPCAGCETWREEDGSLEAHILAHVNEAMSDGTSEPVPAPLLRQPAPRHPFLTMPGPGGRGAWQP